MGHRAFLVACLVAALAAGNDAKPIVRRVMENSKDGRAASTRTCVDGTEFILTLEDGVNANQLVQTLNKKLERSEENKCRSLRHAGSSKQLNAIAACIPGEMDVDAYLSQLMKTNGVVAMEENMAMDAFEAPWHLDRIDQKALPLDGVYTAPGKGAGIRVYVVDTGVEASHDNFEGRVEEGYSVIAGQNATIDVLGHGTHCGGIVGSKDYGAANGATIIPVKVFDDNGGGSTSYANIIEGINWAIADKANHEGSGVMSMSLGGPSNGNEAGEQVLKKAMEGGIVTVVASGNSNTDACGFWPAQSTSVITVGSSTKNDKRSSFSNYGSCQDIYAPGSDILSTYPGNSESTLSGTSMACPLVAGAVALYLEKNPAAGLEELRSVLTRKAVPLPDAEPPLLMYVGDIYDTLPSPPTPAPSPTPEPTPSPFPSVSPNTWVVKSGYGLGNVIRAGKYTFPEALDWCYNEPACVHFDYKSPEQQESFQGVRRVDFLAKGHTWYDSTDYMSYQKVAEPSPTPLPSPSPSPSPSPVGWNYKVQSNKKVIGLLNKPIAEKAMTYQGAIAWCDAERRCNAFSISGKAEPEWEGLETVKFYKSGKTYSRWGWTTWTKEE